jgi:hypothetical protein
MHLMLHDRGDSDIPVAGNSHRRSVSGMDRETSNSVYDHGLDIGYVRHTKRGELLFRQVANIKCHRLVDGGDRVTPVA